MENLIEKTARAIRLINCISRVNTYAPNLRERFTWAIVNAVVS